MESHYIETNKLAHAHLPIYQRKLLNTHTMYEKKSMALVVLKMMLMLLLLLVLLILLIEHNDEQYISLHCLLSFNGTWKLDMSKPGNWRSAVNSDKQACVPMISDSPFLAFSTFFSQLSWCAFFAWCITSCLKIDFCVFARCVTDISKSFQPIGSKLWDNVKNLRT